MYFVHFIYCTGGRRSAPFVIPAQAGIQFVHPVHSVNFVHLTQTN